MTYFLLLFYSTSTTPVIVPKQYADEKACKDAGNRIMKAASVSEGYNTGIVGFAVVAA
jgi:hypothetical protein